VSQFEHGNRHAVYKVAFLELAGTTETVVVRVSHSGTPADRARAEREAKVLERVGGVAAPLLHDFRPTSRWFETPTICMQFVPGRQTDLSSSMPAEIERLGSIVGWVHGRPTDDLDAPSAPTHIASYAESRLHSILATMAWVRDPLPGPIQARIRRAADSVQASLAATRGAASFTSGGTLALLHGDIGPGNILWTPDPVLLDWEYARLGDPADEIAYTFDQNGLTAPQREAFWRGYRASVSAEARLTGIAARLDWWEPVTLLGSTLWWVERWVRRTGADATGAVDPEVAREPGYYFDEVMRRLDRLDA
jgi:aminoglycoside phosphotransferase (APT) family kinase protein